MSNVIELKREDQDFREDAETTDMALFVRTSDESVLHYDLDTADGLAEASFYGVLSAPSLIIEDEEETEVIGWRGTVPTLEEVKRHLPVSLS